MDGQIGGTVMTRKVSRTGRQKVSDEMIGRMQRRFGDIIKRCDVGSLDPLRVLDQLQLIAENGPDEGQASVVSFLRACFRQWYGEGDPRVRAVLSCLVRDPRRQGFFARMVGDVHPDRVSEYTVNPEMRKVDLATAKVFIPDTSEFIGRLKHEVLTAMVVKYGRTHRFPGLEYECFILETNQCPEPLKNGNWYHFIGSLVRHSGGHWHVSYAGWRGSEWGRSADWLGRSWASNDRVVLLEM